jgi:hypothetical protein
MMTAVIMTTGVPEQWSDGVMGKKLNWRSFIGSAFQHSSTPILQVLH